MDTPYTVRHFRRAVAAFFVALVVGAVVFALILHESALDSVYRSTVTLSLTGIDTKPDNAAGEVVTIVLILAGMAIYGYLASSIVELIAHGVLTGTISNRRRRHVIDRISDHYIICGFGRVGRQVGRRVPRRRRPVRRPRLQSRGARDRAAGGRSVPRRQRYEGRGPRGGRSRAGARAGRLLRLGRRQPLHHRLGPDGSTGDPDRRPGLDRGRCEQDAPRRRRSGRSALRRRRPGDCQAHAEAHRFGVSRHRLPARRPRPALRGDRDHDEPAPRRGGRSARRACDTRPAR